MSLLKTNNRHFKKARTNLPLSSRQCHLKAKSQSCNPRKPLFKASWFANQPDLNQSQSKSKQQAHQKTTCPLEQVSRCCKWMIHQKGWCYVPNATRSAVLVLENVCAHHVACLPHVVLQILPLRLIGQIADEDSSALYIFTIRISLLDNSSIVALSLITMMRMIVIVMLRPSMRKPTPAITTAITVIVELRPVTVMVMVVVEAFLRVSARVSTPNFSLIAVVVVVVVIVACSMMISTSIVIVIVSGLTSSIARTSVMPAATAISSFLKTAATRSLTSLVLAEIHVLADKLIQWLVDLAVDHVLLLSRATLRHHYFLSFLSMLFFLLIFNEKACYSLSEYLTFGFFCFYKVKWFTIYKTSKLSH